MNRNWMRQNSLRIRLLLCVLLFILSVAVPVQADDSVETTGDVLTVVLPVTAVGLTIGLRDGQGALQLVESGALSLGVTYGLRYAIDTKRPNGGDHSFPSNHTSLAFTSAEFMRKRYGWEFGIPAYIAATFVAYSRVEAEEHYTRDVLAGAAIGIVSSYLFTRPYAGWSIRPEVGRASCGVRLSRSW